MQIKEYEAYTLKECLQQVRADLGPDAVILETRKIRKGGVLGMGARDAVCLVAATGISVKDDVPALRRPATAPAASTGNSVAGKNSNATLARALAAIEANKRPDSLRSDAVLPATHTGRQSKEALQEEPLNRTQAQARPAASAGQSAAVAAARSAYARAGASAAPAKPAPRETVNPGYSPSNPRAQAAQGYDQLAAEPARAARAGHKDNHRDSYEKEDFRADRADKIDRSDRVDREEKEDDLELFEERYTRQPASQPAAKSSQVAPQSALRSSSSLQQTSAEKAPGTPANTKGTASPAKPAPEERRFALLEKAMQEIREGLNALHTQQQESHERTVSAVVSAVTPALTAAGNMAHLTSFADPDLPRFPDLYARLTGAGVSSSLAHDLLDALPDFDAWSEEAQEPLAVSALRDLIERRVSSAGPIDLTPGTLKAVALIGPTGVGKTTTIAKLAAHFALVEKKRVALLTMDTYRIAAVEQLKIYSQILDIPVGVAYSQAEVAPVVAQYADYDLLLIDTAGRSQKNIMQVGELKSLLEMVGCETHLVLSAQTKESDMVESVQRFSAARVDRLIFSKLDETDSYGTLLNVADHTGIPLSYLTTGQKVPEDLELANGSKLAGLLLN